MPREAEAVFFGSVSHLGYDSILPGIYLDVDPPLEMYDWWLSLAALMIVRRFISIVAVTVPTR